MSVNIFEIIGNISSFIVILPLLLSIYKNKLLNVAQKRLFVLLVVILITELISNILWYLRINNLPVFHFYTIVEFLLILNIYRNELTRLFSKTFFILLSLGYIMFAITNMLFLQDLGTFNSNTTTVMGLVVIFLALSYFYALLKEMKYSSLENNPMFWLNSGFLIYFSSSLILFYINNNMFKESTEASYLVWGLHAIINIVLIIFYTITIWVNPKKQ